MATTINIFIFALFEKERSEVLGDEGLFSQDPAAITDIM